jgi:hypothetical protein
MGLFKFNAGAELGVMSARIEGVVEWVPDGSSGGASYESELSSGAVLGVWVPSDSVIVRRRHSRSFCSCSSSIADIARCRS